ncbi:unnamed protein product [Rangifer tarandus platyrhynchus]|uniref:Uncharacterized protein n=2 Tax=Rangifer tarandus platyrhynchus TaxID=3082113 RepID=A0ACB0ESB8_RANTA|nr:unnamed protein product [Rangifer tarandus platyrhynchus]CAI9703580.1 unnamed protein product [Rangifer tarandus platyrhynchus]
MPKAVTSPALSGGGVRSSLRREQTLQGKKKPKNSGDFQTPGKNRRKQAVAPSPRAEPQFRLSSPAAPNCGSPSSAAASARGRAPVPSPALVGAEPSDSPDRYLPPARAPSAPQLQAKATLRPCTRGPGARRPWPAQRQWRRARRLMLQRKPRAREPRRRRRDWS